MKPVQIRIRIGRIVTDRSLGASRERFAESLSSELSSLLESNVSRVVASDALATHIAQAVILTLSGAKGKDLGPANVNAKGSAQ